MKKNTMEDYFYRIGIGLAPFSAAVVLLWKNMPHIPCLFHKLTGYYCPGCGGTRAVEMLLHGRLLWSIYYHPAVLYGAVLYLGFMISQTIERLWGLRIGLRYRDAYVWLFLIVVIINFALKNYLHYRYGFML